MDVETFVLHGFLGTPFDWKFGRPVDLLNQPEIGPEVPLEKWGEEFNRFVKRVALKRKKKLVGYSMGGRLALHALRADPGLWQKVVVISAHPGLVAEADKEKRLQDDAAWAERFLQEPWEPLLQAWNQQSVFKGSSEPVREEVHYDRKKLALCLKNWSLGHQKDFRPFLRSVSTGWVAMTGELDTKYTELWSNFVGKENHFVVPEAGHRLLFDPKFRLV